MKILKEIVLSSGRRRITVDVGAHEQLIAIQPEGFYKLGYPVEDVVGTHIITDAEQVAWCSASQAWQI